MSNTEKKESMKVNVSFKKHEKWLFDKIAKGGDKSNKAKDLLKIVAWLPDRIIHELESHMLNNDVDPNTIRIVYDYNSNQPIRPQPFFNSQPQSSTPTMEFSSMIDSLLDE